MKNALGQFDEEAYALFMEMATEEYAQRIDKDSMPCNKPRALRDSSDKSHVVKACGDGIGPEGKLIKFGMKGSKHAGAPKKGESAAKKAKRKSFKARHGANIKKGKSSAAFWSNKVKW